jgi:hypothetical protein
MHATRKAAPVRTTSSSDAFLFPRGWDDAAEAEQAQKDEELSQARVHVLRFVCAERVRLTRAPLPPFPGAA